MKTHVYLAGQISFNDNRTFEWRNDIRNEYEEDNEIEIIDPCNNRFNSNNTNKDHYSHENIEVLTSKDKNYVLKSDVCIVNLNMYDKNKPLVGTLFELAWYINHPEKTVIGICPENESNGYNNHPFVRSAITTWVTNHWYAITAINEYFKGI